MLVYIGKTQQKWLEFAKKYVQLEAESSKNNGRLVNDFCLFKAKVIFLRILPW